MSTIICNVCYRINGYKLVNLTEDSLASVSVYVSVVRAGDLPPKNPIREDLCKVHHKQLTELLWGADEV